MADETVDVIVVGSGISGLACANTLTKAGVATTVLEAGPRPGGRVWTEQFDGCAVESGAHFFNDRYEATWRLVRDAGLEHDVTSLSSGFVTAVWRAGRWAHLDYTSRASIARFPGVDPARKASILRAAAAIAPVARHLRFYDLASAAPLDARRPAELIDRDVLTYQVLPIYQAFCGYEVDEVGLPMLALGARFRFGTPRSLRGGLGRLPEVLGRRLGVRLGVRVRSVRAEGPGVVVESISSDGAPEVHRARAAVLAVPPEAALRVWPGAGDATRRFLGAQRYSPFLLVYLRTREAYAPRSETGEPVFMDVVPLGERDGVLEHAYYGSNAAAPDGGVILAGAYPWAAAEEPDDEALADRLQAELEELRPALAAR